MSNLSECYKSTPNNIMMNFMPFDDRLRGPACKEKIENNTGIKNIYTMPVTTSIPDTMEFARFLFPNPARCRETGYLCVTNADSTLSLDRLAYYKDESNYQTVNNKFSPNPKFSYSL
jgi:hypothetical protein